MRDHGPGLDGRTTTTVKLESLCYRTALFAW